MFKRIAAVLLVVGGMVALTGCNTVAGVGKDISDSAHAVQRAL